MMATRAFYEHCMQQAIAGSACKYLHYTVNRRSA